MGELGLEGLELRPDVPAAVAESVRREATHEDEEPAGADGVRSIAGGSEV